MITAFLLSATLLGSIIVLIGYAVVTAVRPFSTRAAYVVAVILFFAALAAPVAMLLPDDESPRLAATGTVMTTITVRQNLTALPLLWILGTSVLIVRELRGHWRLASLRGEQLGAGDRALLQIPETIAVEVIAGSAPMTIGALRPRILLPPELLDHRRVATRAVLAHEIEHVRWRDPLCNAVLRILLALFWPMLPLWALERVIRREREIAADASAVADLDATGVGLYAEAMLTSARGGAGRFSLGVAQSDLEHRVRRLLRQRGSAALTLLASMTGVALTVAMAAFVPAVRYVSLPRSKVSHVEERRITRQTATVESKQGSASSRSPVRKRATPSIATREELPFGSSLRDLLTRTPDPNVHRHVTSSVNINQHAHRTGEARPALFEEVVVIRDVRREVVRVSK